MKYVAADDAKSHIGTLLDDVEQGDDVIVDLRGDAMAKVVAVRPEHDVEAARAAIRRIREFAKRWGIRATPEEIKSWIEEGRP